MLVRTRAAMRSLASLSHARVRLSGFFWMQGEWDTDTRAHASAYRANLARLIARVRTDLDAPRLPFVIGRIRDIRTFNPNRPFSDVVRAAQAGAADTDPNAFLVSTDGLSLDPRSRIHFDTHGTVGLGERFAQRRFGL
jgi:hypothetical protein